jgi:hypothetical protein
MVMNTSDSVRRAIASRSRRGVGNAPGQPGPSPFVGPPKPVPTAKPGAKRKMGDTVRATIGSRARRGVSSSQVLQAVRARRGGV